MLFTPEYMKAVPICKIVHMFGITILEAFHTTTYGIIGVIIIDHFEMKKSTLVLS